MSSVKRGYDEDSAYSKRLREARAECGEHEMDQPTSSLSGVTRSPTLSTRSLPMPMKGRQSLEKAASEHMSSSASSFGSCFDYEPSCPSSPVAALQPIDERIGSDDEDGLSSHDIVLQSSEGRRYRFSLDILAKYSHFAEGLLSLPPVSSASSSRLAANQSSDPPPDLDVPIRGDALSYALECILALYHSREVEPLPKMYGEEVFTFVDILDCPEFFQELLQRAPDTDIPAKFALAILTDDHDKVTELSIRLLAYSDDYYTSAWWMTVIQAKAPHVARQLATLFDNWNSSYLYFQSRMTPKFPRTVFSHKVYWLPSGSPCDCDQHIKYRGNFHDFHTAAIRPLWNSFATHPLVPPEVGAGEARPLCPQFPNLNANIDQLGIECSICRGFMYDNVKAVLSDWPQVDWSAKRKLGLSVAPWPADLDAWLVYSNPDGPPKEVRPGSYTSAFGNNAAARRTMGPNEVLVLLDIPHLNSNGELVFSDDESEDAVDEELPSVP